MCLGVVPTWSHDLCCPPTHTHALISRWGPYNVHDPSFGVTVLMALIPSLPTFHFPGGKSGYTNMRRFLFKFSHREFWMYLAHSLPYPRPTTRKATSVVSIRESKLTHLGSWTQTNKGSVGMWGFKGQHYNACAVRNFLFKARVLCGETAFSESGILLVNGKFTANYPLLPVWWWWKMRHI